MAKTMLKTIQDAMARCQEVWNSLDKICPSQAREEGLRDVCSHLYRTIKALQDLEDLEVSRLEEQSGGR